MKPGRVEYYIHSDSYTENKGGCIFVVRCGSDAAANTKEFKIFCRAVAPFVYASETDNVFDVFPEAVKLREEIENKLHEKIFITDVKVVKL